MVDAVRWIARSDGSVGSSGVEVYSGPSIMHWRSLSRLPVMDLGILDP